MAGIYNSFQIKLEKAELIEQAKEITQSLIQKNNYKLGDWLVWDTIEVSGSSITAKNYLGFDYTDLDKSKELFSGICMAIIQKMPDIRFTGNHCFEYSNVDHADHLFSFYRDGLYAVYEGGTEDGEGYLLTCSVYALEDGKLTDPKIFEYDQDEYDGDEMSADVFSAIREAYENGAFPELPDMETPRQDKTVPPPPEDGGKGVGKQKLFVGRLYQVRYSNFGESKEIIGKLEDYDSKEYEFERLGSDDSTEYIHERNIETVAEVFETSETRRIKEEYEHTVQEIENGEKEQSALRSRFYAEYSENGSNWDSRPLKATENKLEPIEEGKTYLAKVKRNLSVIGSDAILVADCAKDFIGDSLRCLTCDPNISKSDITMIRPVIAANLDELTHELILDEKASEIQRQRVELYHRLNDLRGKRRQLNKDYLASFKRS